MRTESPTLPGGEQGDWSACGDTQMVSETPLPHTPTDSHTGMVTQTGRRAKTRPPDEETEGRTYMHTDTHSQTEALGRSNTMTQDFYKKGTETHTPEHPEVDSSRCRGTQTHGNRPKDF